MATTALDRPAPTEKRVRIVFKKRQLGAKLWNRFHSTSLFDKAGALELVAELRETHKHMEFDLEVEKI